MIKKLKKYQSFWNLVGLLSGFYPLNRFGNLPKEIAVELTNHCNLKCPVCPTHFAMTRTKGFMDFNLFKTLIDEFKNEKNKPRINFIFAGEPLLHPEVDRFISYATLNGHNTVLSTNATVLSDVLGKKIIESGLSSIHLCLDGFSKQSHEAYRVGSDFNTVKDNIEKFIKEKSRLGKKYPITCLQTLLTSYSEKEVESLINWGRSIGADKIQFKSLSMGSFTNEVMRQKYRYLLPANKTFLRRKSKIKRTVCTVPLSQSVIFWDGYVGLCCVDFNGKMKFGYIKNGGFIKNFLSRECRQQRKIGWQKKFPLCQKCSLSEADFVGWHVDLK